MKSKSCNIFIVHEGDAICPATGRQRLKSLLFEAMILMVDNEMVDRRFVI